MLNCPPRLQEIRGTVSRVGTLSPLYSFLMHEQILKQVCATGIFAAPGAMLTGFPARNEGLWSEDRQGRGAMAARS